MTDVAVRLPADSLAAAALVVHRLVGSVTHFFFALSNVVPSPHIFASSISVGKIVSHFFVALSSTQPSHLDLAASMATQVTSSVAAATHFFETVDHLGLAASMTAHVVSSAPLATQVLGVAVEQTSVPGQPEAPIQATQAACLILR